MQKRIQIGLAGWGDHDDIYPKGTKAGDKLKMYGSRFPIVELDSSFYAIPSPERMRKWSEQTSESFGFIVKAYQGMTGHTRGKIPFPDARSMFQAFRESAAEMREMGKLKAVLFQYPPWFACERKHVDILRRTREWMDGFPLALEFRHRSWFDGEMRDKTLSFMREEGWIHSVCDEPQAGEGSIPAIIEPTREDFTLVRLHGRNAAGWQSSGQPNWREVRYLYRYNEEELLEWKDNISKLLGSTQKCWIIFNNNSGGDAANNAMQLMKLLNLDMPDLPPNQLSLFEE
ncbi:DUF72 domain-containing protein [Paenibacillus sp.]|jgi:uncharacterized protein YecE (DUF72 family)|uniref:DUF72 domain-containing protein n=1 Tax=Paenibacillus sp. TaxID=58172 RepID=UPI0028296C59|nr:DUF72 domain-containing protein [Paenibacillus sp.]MDR0267350.1 DUF72 domain-containing protein [Paenibacillus sp.]